MGFAIAEELANRGSEVILIAGPVSLKTKNKNIKRIDIVSAEEMNEQCIKYFPETNGAIMCAAVADFTPVVKSEKKVKRGKENFLIELKPNPDIAAGLGEIKKEGQILAGFALETDNEEKNAILKLQKKNLDFIVLNSLNDKGAGFQSDTNKITIIDKYNKSFKFELKSKVEVAKDIIDHLIEKMGL
jgi:phosphopantothenoylcysteine decarboxylase/phosphopantothenate--cysteine ligase